MVDVDNTTNTAKHAISVRNLAFRYRAFDDDMDASTVVNQPLAIQDVSLELAKGKLLLIAGSLVLLALITTMNIWGYSLPIASSIYRVY